MKKNIVVINQFGEFVQATGFTQTKGFTSGKFVKEYPEATVFTNITAAKRIVSAMKRSKQYCASYIAIENYGNAEELITKIG